MGKEIKKIRATVKMLVITPPLQSGIRPIVCAVIMGVNVVLEQMLHNLSIHRISKIRFTAVIGKKKTVAMKSTLVVLV